MPMARIIIQIKSNTMTPPLKRRGFDDQTLFHPPPLQRRHRLRFLPAAGGAPAPVRPAACGPESRRGRHPPGAQRYRVPGRNRGVVARSTLARCIAGAPDRRGTAACPAHVLGLAKMIEPASEEASRP